MKSSLGWIAAPWLALVATAAWGGLPIRPIQENSAASATVPQLAPQGSPNADGENRWTNALSGAQLALNLTDQPASAEAAPVNYQGLWWGGEAEAGWGINFAHQGDVIFATWFTYNFDDGSSWWLSMTADKVSDGVYSGTLYETSGPPWTDANFDPINVRRGEPGLSTGTGTLTFTSASTGKFTYTVANDRHAASQTKAITRETFGPLPTCVWGAQPDLSKATNFTDLWWASPPGSEDGWGVNLSHQGTTIFATWFSYGRTHNAQWYSVTAFQTAPNTYFGTLELTTGPSPDAPFNPAMVGRNDKGTATFTFTDGNNGTFSYIMTDPAGVVGEKRITREVFRAPGTICE